jgi:hypothetical protein
MNLVDETTAARFVAELYYAGGLTSETGFLVADSAVSNSIGNTLKKNHQLSPDLLKGMIGTTPSLGNLTPMTDCIRKRTPFNGQLTYPAFESFWEARFKCKMNEGTTCTASVSARNTTCKCPETDTLSDYTPNNKIALVNDAVFTLAQALHMIIYNCSAVSTSLCNSPDFALSDVITALQKVQLVGDTGDISFDGPNRKQIFFDIQQFGSIWSTVGYYNTTGFSLDSSALAWASKRPISRKSYSVFIVIEISPFFVSYSEPIAIFVVLMSSLNIIVAIGVAILFSVMKEKPVIKRASPVFCQLILLGLIMIWISLILWTGYPTTATCNIKLWFFLVGYALIMSNLLFKTYRIWKIFEVNKSTKAQNLSNSDLLKYSTVVVLIEIVILIALMVVDLPRPQMFATKTSDYYRYMSCGSKSQGQMIITIIFIVFNVLMILMGAILAFLTRNAHSSFNESKFIGLSVNLNILIELDVQHVCLCCHSVAVLHVFNRWKGI